ncbi:MAG: hypothetical protein JW840_07795, partial [Candidatus Thermoplasmatota archaeon]|nr:hypothetical protein [Candidatus Thermoplasmatota archaeon]
MKKTIEYIFITIFLGIILTQMSIASQFEKHSDNTIIQRHQGNTLYVGGSGPGNYSKIQNAINNASEGDIIYVFQGTYYEVLSVSKQLCIKGEKKESTIIDAQKKGYTINISADGVNITGFTIQNGSYSSNLINEANLFIFSYNNIISGNIFRYSESGIM